MTGISNRRFPDTAVGPDTSAPVTPVTRTGVRSDQEPSVSEQTLDGEGLVVPPGPSASAPAAAPLPDGASLPGEVAVDPATGRPAGRAQALVLLLSSCLAVLGAVLLAPVLPRIEDAFADTPGVEALTPIVLTAPALVIGLTAM